MRPSEEEVLSDLSLDDLVRIVVEAVYDARGQARMELLSRLVHGDIRVPSRVKDEDVQAAVVVAVSRGWLTFEDGWPEHLCLTYLGRKSMYLPGGRTRAEAYELLGWER